jgi:flotillin
MGRKIIPKHVLDVEPGILDLHDRDHLPFGVEISIKVQVTDSQKAAETLTEIDLPNVKKVVEDTVMSAARSIAMERTITDIMMKREEIEESMYSMVSAALNKLGLSAIIFDIKNIIDLEGKEVIGSLERVKIAELKKTARISEAVQDNEAQEVEIERRKLTQVKAERMKQEEEMARLEREKEVAQNEMKVEAERLKMDEQKKIQEAEANKKQKTIIAQSEADSVRKQAEAKADAIKIESAAQAEAIRAKGMAEVDVLKEKSEALKAGTVTAQLQILEILKDAQIETAGKVAEALGANNKIMFLPMDDGSNFLANLLPKITGLVESGAISQLIKEFPIVGRKTTRKITHKKEED